jgi:membrane protein implicated in regulation of membrane protease activity
MLVALVGLGLPIQILAAVAASVGMVALVRPNIVSRLHSGPELTLGHSALVGKQGVVVDEVSAHTGQIKIGGEVWTARAYDETETIEPGATVDVFEIRGATALVHKVPSLDV